MIYKELEHRRYPSISPTIILPCNFLSLFFTDLRLLDEYDVRVLERILARNKERGREMANAAVSRCTHEPIRGGPHVNKVRSNNLRNALNSPLVCGFATK